MCTKRPDKQSLSVVRLNNSFYFNYKSFFRLKTCTDHLRPLYQIMFYERERERKLFARFQFHIFPDEKCFFGAGGGIGEWRSLIHFNTNHFNNL
jgi:hypothetical protein